MIKYLKKYHFFKDRVSNVVKDEFEIESIDSTSIKILIYLSGNSDYEKIELFGNNTIQIIYNEMSDVSSNFKKINNNKSDIVSNSGLISTNTSDIASNSGLISTNTSDISSNLSKINTNISSIASNLEKINDLQNSNIKAFYNLDKIFIYDIEKGD